MLAHDFPSPCPYLGDLLFFIFNGHSFLSCFTECFCSSPLSLVSAAMVLSVLVVDRLEGPCHVGQFLHATGTPHILNASCAETPWSRCGTAAALGQPKSKGRAGVTWSLLTPSCPKLGNLLADPKKGPVHVRHAPGRSPIPTSRSAHSPPLPRSPGSRSSCSAQARQTLWQTLWHHFFKPD